MNRMLSAAFVAATLAGVSAPAHAANVYYNETCGASVLSVGTYSKDRDVNVTVVYNNGGWRVVHTLSNGHVYERGLQYDLSDATTIGSDGLVYARWTGSLRRNPALQMVGSLGMHGNVPTYVERLTKDGQVVMQSEAVCTFDNAPAPSAPTTVQNGVGRSPTVVSLISTDNHLSEHVTVSLGSQTVDMMLDTGAMLGSVSESIAATLIASGEANWNEDGHAILADGSTVAEKRINIHHVTIGGRTVDNVLLGVVPDGKGMMLLGMQVLRSFGKFTIDAANDQLILG
jgi:clan AA aspartic protease (TIGR02281 family)